jgi:superfamily II DNA or RNA helicase
VHRIELVDQIADLLASFDIDVGIISANNKPEPDKAVQVTTIQTLSRRDPPPADIILDECYHSKADT